MPDELEQKINWCIEVSKAKGIDLPAQLSTVMRAHFLVQALDLIGAHRAGKRELNQFIDELRLALQAKYGGSDEKL